MRSKTEFLEKKFSPKIDYSKSFVFDIFRDDKFSIQNLTFWNFFFQLFIVQEKFCFRIWLLFFLKISFQTLIFNEKGSYKVMLLKMSTKSEQLNVLCGANRVKTLFLICDVFIEIWFLNENWIQNLNFRKNSLSTKRLLEKNFSKPARTKNSLFKNWSICRKKLHFKIRIFFQKIPFQTLIFNEKACFKIIPFKISTKSEKLVVVCGANRVKTLFLRRDVFIEIWFLNLYWTQNLIFRKILSPQNHFSNSILSKSARTKNSRFKNWSICRKKLLFKIRHFFQKIPFQISDFQRKGLLQNHAFWNKHEKWKLCCFSRSNFSQNVFFLMWFFDRNPISQ